MPFAIFGSKKQTRFDKEKDRILDQLSTLSAESKTYADAVKNYDLLCKTATYKKDGSVSMDTIITVTANILGIALVLGYEQAHVVTSKALNFIIKPK